MKTLSIKNVPETLHEQLKKRARHNHRSLNGELLALLERAVATALTYDLTLVTRNGSDMQGSGARLINLWK